MKKLLLILGVIFFAVISCGCAFNPAAAQSLKIEMLNVGQGDAILIQTDNKNILIDTSDTDEREKLIKELYREKVFTFDKLILTHPHADHIGSADYLLKSGVFTVKSVFDNGIVSKSQLYRRYMATVETLNIPRGSLKAGDKIQLDEEIYFEVLSPDATVVEEVNTEMIKGDPNNESIVARLTFGEFSMLFMGDAETPLETQLIKSGANLKADVLKVGHHGAKSASSLKFLRAVRPKYALISAGEPTTKRGGNTYGHPRAEVLENCLIANVPKENIFWTYYNGAITVLSDGKTFSVTPQIKVDWFNQHFFKQTGETIEVSG